MPQKLETNMARIHNCPVETCLELLSGKWKPRILWKLHQNEVMRFNQLRRSIAGGITAKMLTQQLRELEPAQPSAS